MNLIEAQQIIAEVVTGRRRVASKEVDSAYDILKQNSGYKAALSELLEAASEDCSCQDFQGRIAEFRELSPAEREDELPEMAAHAEFCLPCRRALWEKEQKIWKTLATAARTHCRVLTEPLRLVLQRGERIEERGTGFPSVEPFLALGAQMTLGPSDDLAPPLRHRRKEWFLKDDDADCGVRLLVELTGTGQTTLRCSLEGETGKVPQLDQVRIEIRRARSNSLFLAGPLSNFQADPIVLTPEAWLIKLIPSNALDILPWEIPLELENSEDWTDD